MQVPGSGSDDEETPNAGPSLFGAVLKKPDIEAARQRLTRETGIPADAIRARPQDAERQSKLQAINPTQLQLGAPRTSSFLANPQNAAVAHDDVENMTVTERLLKAAANTPAALATGLFSASAGAFEAGVALQDATDAINIFRYLDPKGYEKRLGERRAFEARFRKQGVQVRDQIRPKGQGLIEDAYYSGMESTSQNLVAIFSGGGPTAVLAKVLLPQAGTSYRKALDEGLDPASAAYYAAAQVAIEYGTEKIPLADLMKNIKVGTPVFETLVKNIAQEQVGEQVATVSQDLTDWALLPSNKDKTLADFIAERPEAALSTAVAALTGSVTTTSVLAATDRVSRALERRTEKTVKAGEDKSYLDTMAQVAQASKLRERAPETFQQFVNEAAADGALTDVFVDKDVLLQALGETGIEAPPEVAAQLATVAPGSDVRVSIGDFATYLSEPEVYGKLADHLKTEPGGLTYAQSQEQAKEALDGLASTFDKALAVALTDEQFRASRDKVQEQFFAEQKAAGRFTDDVSNQYAFLNAQLVAVMANRVGMTPEELLARKPISTKAGDSRAGKKVFEQIPPDVAASLPYATRLPNDPVFIEAAANTEGAEITPEGLKLSLVRFQKSAQSGEQSVRTGVFYLPKGSKNTRYYNKAGPGQNYGGGVKVSGDTLLKAPLFVKGATGGKAPEAAFIALRGKDAFKKLTDDVSRIVSANSYLRKQNPGLIEEEIGLFLEEYDGSSNDAYGIIENSKQGNQLRYALQEYAVAHAVRAAGFDSVVGYSKGKAGANISEVFDVREVYYPTPEGDFEIHDQFLSGAFDQVLNQYDPGLSGFRSVLYETVRDKGSMKARASEWKGLLGNTPGVKKEEMEWMGLFEFLDIKGGGVEEGQNLPISKADVLAFIEENGVKLQERILSEDAEVDYYEDPRYYEILNRVEDEARENYIANQYVEPEYRVVFGFELDGRIVEGARPRGEYLTPPKVGDWDFDSTFVAPAPEPELPPGPPNRELFPGADLGTAPPEKREGSWYVIDEEDADEVEIGGEEVNTYTIVEGPYDEEGLARRAYQKALEDHREEAESNVDINDLDEEAITEEAMRLFREEYGGEERPKWGEYKVPGGDNYREMLLNLEGDQNFTGSHWSDIPNVMAHARLTDRTDAEGRNVLYVEEIQSDWHQQARTKGYKEKVDPARLEAATKTYEAANVENMDARLVFDNLANDFYKHLKETLLFEVIELKAERAKAALSDYRADQYKLAMKLNNAVSSFMDANPALSLDEAFAAAYELFPSYDRNNTQEDGFIAAELEARYVWSFVKNLRYSSESGGDFKWFPAEYTKAYFIKIAKEQYGEDVTSEPLFTEFLLPAEIAHLRYEKSVQDAQEARATYRSLKFQEDKLPDAPFKKSWPELVVKRLIAYAVENNYDRVALPDGNVIGNIVGAGDKASWFYEENLVNIANKLIKKSGQKLTLEPLYSSGGFVARYQGEQVEAKFFDINDALKSEVEMMGLPLFQGEARGTFNPSTGVITLNKTANLSTWLHELGHYQLELLADLATGPDAIPEIKADMDAVLGWFSTDADQPITLDMWNAMSLNDKREYHEQFARGFEAYLFEGKAPSTELRGIFQRFRAWMLQVYRELKNLNVELNDEVRGVFDRMLASEEAITNAQEARGMEAAFANRPEGMTEAEWEAYQRIQQEATADAIDTLQTRSLRDMKWVSSQRSKVIRDLQRSAREMYKATKAEVEAEVMQEPVYLAREYLKYGKLYGDEPSPDSRKLDLDMLKAMFPESSGVDLTSLTRGGKYGLTQRDGVHPDVIAEMFGFESGDALVRALISAEPMNEKITGITDQRMLERHGDLTDQAAIEAAADQIIHNDARARAVHTELSYAEKAQGKKTPVLQAARAFAENLVNRTLLRNLRPDLAESAAERARRAAQTALKNDDLALFAAQKRNELVHVQSVRAQVKAKQELTSTMSFFARIVTAKDEAVAKRRDLNLVMAARAVLAAHGIGRKSQNPQEYLDRVLAYDPDVGQQLKLDVAAATIGATGDFKDLTVEQMRGLRDVVNQLWDLAKTSKEMEVGGEKIALDDAVNQLVQELQDGPPPKYVGLGQDRGVDDRSLFLPGGGIGLPLLGAAALGRRVESWATAKGQAWSRFTFRVVSKAADQYRTALAVAVAQYRAILEPVSTDMKRQKIDAPELGYTFGNDSTGIGMAELLGALRHTGNPSNLKKLLLGRGWADVAPDGSMDTTRWENFLARMHREGVIQKRHWDFVQAEWDLHETLKPQAQKAHKAMYGRYFDEVTAAPVDTPFGSYRGGYVAAATDPNIVDDAALRKEAEDMFGGGSALFPAPANGFTKSRVENYTRPLALNIGMAISQMDRVLRFAYLGPAVRDVNRLLRRPDLREVLKGYDPVAITDVLSPWLERSASQQVVTPPRGRAGGWVDKAMRLVRSRTSMALLFFNLSNTLQNVTGLGPASLRTGKRNLLEASMTYLRDPAGTAERIANLSPMMAMRNNTQFEELQSEVRDIILNPNQYQKAQDWFARNAQWLQRGLQSVLDNMVWQGAYNRAIQEQDVDPVGFADSAVRETMGAFGAEDVSRIETGSAVLRNFTLFFGYFNTQANLLGTEFAKAPTAGRALNVYAMGLLIPSLGAQMIAEAMRGNLFAGDDDEEKLMAMVQLFFTSQLSYLTAMFPGVGPAILAGVNSFDDKPFNDRINLSPVISQVEAAIALPKALYELATEEEINTPKAIRDTATLVSLATGIPVSALARPVSYAVAVAEGDVEPTGPIDYARGLVTGVASNASKE